MLSYPMMEATALSTATNVPNMKDPLREHKPQKKPRTYGIWLKNQMPTRHRRCPFHKTLSPISDTQYCTMLFLSVAMIVLLGGCRMGYLAKSAYYQMELLDARVPVDEVRKTETLTEEERKAFDLVVDVKQYGKEIGLSGSANYDTIAWDWDRRIWNISASEPLRFAPNLWWFPIVGTVPYLGFFREEEARYEATVLAQEGWEVYVRTAGTYSTLGWFEDPLLVPMLAWSTYDLANVILHELTHATVWVGGSVAFNESFANFVGDVAAFRYLKNRFGASSKEYRRAQYLVEDRARWRKLLTDLYQELNSVYENPALDREQKLAHKRALYGSVPQRIRNAKFRAEKGYLQYAALGPWNNARLIQFRTYNSHRDNFQAILDQNNGDLLAFMNAIKTIANDADDPYQALDKAAKPQHTRKP